jgi:ABC-type Fe3+-hydroxamate transport system substrate-binding protein
MISLGLEDRLVGVTDHCPVTSSLAAKAARVGGVLDSNVEAIIALTPDLVIADQEENEQSRVDEIKAAGIQIWLTFPRSVEDSIKNLWTMVRLFGVEKESGERIRVIERSLDWVSRTAWENPACRVFCPIWREQTDPVGTWWMTFNWDTYCHSVLRHCGGLNIFENRKRIYPLLADLGQIDSEDAGNRDTRYPRVLPQEVIEKDPDIILIPSEPYPFSRDEIAELKELLSRTSAVSTGNVIPIDGRLITWHGTRLAKALIELPNIFNREMDSIHE